MDENNNGEARQDNARQLKRWRSNPTIRHSSRTEPFTSIISESTARLFSTLNVNFSCISLRDCTCLTVRSSFCCVLCAMSSSSCNVTIVCKVMKDEGNIVVTNRRNCPSDIFKRMLKSTCRQLMLMLML